MTFLSTIGTGLVGLPKPSGSGFFTVPGSAKPKAPPGRSDEEIAAAATAERLRAARARGRAGTITGASTGLFGVVSQPQIRPGILV